MSVALLTFSARASRRVSRRGGADLRLDVPPPRQRGAKRGAGNRGASRCLRSSLFSSRELPLSSLLRRVRKRRRSAECSKSRYYATMVRAARRAGKPCNRHLRATRTSRRPSVQVRAARYIRWQIKARYAMQSAAEGGVNAFHCSALPKPAYANVTLLFLLVVEIGGSCHCPGRGCSRRSPCEPPPQAQQCTAANVLTKCREPGGGEQVVQRGTVIQWPAPAVTYSRKRPSLSQMSCRFRPPRPREARHRECKAKCSGAPARASYLPPPPCR